MEVYVDDMLVKSVQRANHLQHLDKSFNFLRQYKVKLNPEKYTFGVASGDIWSLNWALKRPRPDIYNSEHESTHLCK